MMEVKNSAGAVIGSFDVGPRANLRGADLHGADLQRANLRGADLRGANLNGTDLSRASLSEADLGDAYLRGAMLCGADLSGASLRKASLRKANLTEADLWGASLWGADLQRANLRGADLREATYNLLAILQALWRGSISGELCAAMMAFDRESHPNPDAFKAWAQGGRCPCTTGVSRALIFSERRECYSHSLAAPTPWKLWQMIAAEFNIKI